MAARPNLAVVNAGAQTSLSLRPGASDPRVGKHLGGSYRIVRRIGAGGMGDVYEAEHTRLHQRFAVKFLDASLAANAEAYARFRQEAEIAASLAHDSIVQVVDFNEDDTGDSYIVMEYVEGQTLGDWLEGRRLAPKEMLRLLEPLCSALAAAHAAGVVHRDLKPSNIMVAGSGSSLRVKLLDFGISKVKGGITAMTRANVVMGTPNYMSPEQASGNTHTVDAPTDVFSLGALIYEMLAGRRAFDNESTPVLLHAIVYDQPKPLDQIVSGLPSALIAVVDKCLAKAPGDRFPDTQSLIVALRAAVRPPRRAVAQMAANDGQTGHRWGWAALTGWGLAAAMAVGTGAMWATVPPAPVTEIAEPPVASPVPTPEIITTVEPTYRPEIATPGAVFLENEDQLYRADARGLSYWPDPEAETTMRPLPSIAPITVLARSREGEIVAGQADGTVSRWDHLLRENVWHKRLLSEPVEQLAAAAGYIAVASGTTVNLFHGESGKSLRSFSGNSRPVALLFARTPTDSLYIVRDDAFEIVDADRRKSVASIPLSGRPLRASVLPERVGELPEVEIDFLQGDWIMRRRFRVQQGRRGQAHRLEALTQRKL